MGAWASKLQAIVQGLASWLPPIGLLLAAVPAVALAAVALVTSWTQPASAPLPPATYVATTTPAPAGYTVRGNQILDANGQPHLFHGVDRPSLEWSPQGEHLSAADYQNMASWGANVVRIALDQDYWLKGSALYDPTYAARIDQQIAWAHAAGLDVILDLHWSDRGDLSDTKPGQQDMPDENSLEFWREVAARYKNDPHVLFELYNEPHDVSWSTWLDGGWVEDGFLEGYQAVGMQQLADAVRSTGAKNLILAGGLDWANDLSGVPDHKVQGDGIVYVTHDYQGAGDDTPADWDSHFGFLTATEPVIATEFGSQDGKGDYDSAFLAYAQAKGISWTAWAWYPGGPSFPSLLSDWSGTPTAAGQVVRAALESFAAKAPAPAATAPATTPEPATPPGAKPLPAPAASEAPAPGFVGALAATPLAPSPTASETAPSAPSEPAASLAPAATPTARAAAVSGPLGD